MGAAPLWAESCSAGPVKMILRAEAMILEGYEAEAEHVPGEGGVFLLLVCNISYFVQDFASGKQADKLGSILNNA